MSVYGCDRRWSERKGVLKGEREEGKKEEKEREEGKKDACTRLRAESEIEEHSLDPIGRGLLA